MASNIKHIDEITKNLTDSNLFSLEIQKILLDYLKKVKTIVTEINKTSTSNIKEISTL